MVACFVFRSDNGGDNWKHISDSAGLKQRAWYYTTLTIDPNNEDVVWFPQVGMYKTIDGGKSVLKVEAGGWDHHDIWIDPKNSKRIADASDGGVSISVDGGETWNRARIPMVLVQAQATACIPVASISVIGSLLVAARQVSLLPIRTIRKSSMPVNTWES